MLLAYPMVFLDAELASRKENPIYLCTHLGAGERGYSSDGQAFAGLIKI